MDKRCVTTRAKSRIEEQFFADEVRIDIESSAASLAWKAILVDEIADLVFGDAEEPGRGSDTESV